MPYPIPENESERLAALPHYGILDTMPEQEYDDIARLSATICGTTMSTVALIDQDRKWHKAKYGLDKEFVPREISICSHTILDDAPLIVEDTLEHDVFKNIGMVINPPNVRFYAGVPLVNPEGLALGTLWVIDKEPKTIDDAQRTSLEAYGRQLVTLLELRRSNIASEQRQQELQCDQEEILERNSHLEELSFKDDLTGVYNRRILDSELANALVRCNCNGKPFAMMMLDLDDLKEVNDAFGHWAGDDAILFLAKTITQNIRQADCCVRFGGDEFIVLMPDTGVDGAKMIAHRIQQKLKQGSESIEQLSASIGVAVSAAADCDAQALLDFADSCVYKAKSEGKNRIVVENL